MGTNCFKRKDAKSQRFLCALRLLIFYKMGELMLSHHHLYFLEQIGSKYKVVKFLVCAIHNHSLVAFPFLSSLADESDIIANTHN